MTPDDMVLMDSWSDLNQHQQRPYVDVARLHSYRMDRLREEMARNEVSLCVMTSPVSMRYAVDLRSYALFTAHIPSTYLFLPIDGEFQVYNGLSIEIPPENQRRGLPISFMYGGDELDRYAEELADQIVAFLWETGQPEGRVAMEYVNPSIVLALRAKGIDVVDGVRIVERARMIKNVDEVNCIRWAIAVAELGATKVQEALRPGITENQLWGLLNYTNQANDGDWHDGRMLASGPRINPWLQEATDRRIESGDLVGFDTDMVGPMGYCADLSRTFHCGPAKPTDRQKELYGFAMAEIEHNLAMVKAGVSFRELQENAWAVPEAFQKHAYTCILHGVGMCDEYPHLHPVFRGELPYDDHLQAGMVVCVESFIGAEGERDGVKLEQQLLVTETGYELLTRFPFCEDLIG